MAGLVDFTMTFNGYTIGVETAMNNFVAFANIPGGLFGVQNRVPEFPYGGIDGSFSPAEDTALATLESKLITLEFEIVKPTPADALDELQNAVAAFAKSGLTDAVFSLDGVAITYSCVAKGLVDNLAALHQGRVSCQGTLLALNPNPVVL